MCCNLTYVVKRMQKNCQVLHHPQIAVVLPGSVSLLVVLRSDRREVLCGFRNIVTDVLPSLVSVLWGSRSECREVEGSVLL